LRRSAGIGIAVFPSRAEWQPANSTEFVRLLAEERKLPGCSAERCTKARRLAPLGWYRHRDPRVVFPLRRDCCIIARSALALLHTAMK
jgi:hypothetical protein